MISVSQSNSTVADSYRQINVTIGNRTVLEEGYYYLNNFNNILSSFGMCTHSQIHTHLMSVYSLVLFVKSFFFLCHVSVTLFELTVVNNWYITMVSTWTKTHAHQLSQQIISDVPSVKRLYFFIDVGMWCPLLFIQIKCQSADCCVSAHVIVNFTYV